MRKYIILIGSLIYIFAISNQVFAQIDTSGIAVPIPINPNQEFKNGDIICNKDGFFSLCEGEYHSEIYGIVTLNPAASFEYEDKEDTVPVQTSGIALTRVRSVNGNIVKGDLITTSEMPGVGEKSARNGYVLGNALESYENSDINAVGEILVAINIHPAAGLQGARSNLINVLREGLSAPLFEPLAALRYVLAALILLLSFVLGFAYFGRVSKTGIEAIGRNPLASRMIQISIMLHILITIVIILVGLGMAYIILIL
ncbi:MAG TPA: hypothetical protein VI819_03730 [Patescibacteria group bacterium]|nr:hypothetical protein [Patescibacteria group bacterium]